MRSIKTLTMVLLLMTAGTSFAQGGIRWILLNYEPVFKGMEGDMVHMGLGYDHDVNERLSYGIDLRHSFDSESWVGTYRSRFHFSDAGSTSVYFGPSIGVRSIAARRSKVLVPLGLRLGLRGGLENFFGDIYAGVIYNAGHKGDVLFAEDFIYTIRPVTFSVGLDIGWGWD